MDRSKLWWTLSLLVLAASACASTHERPWLEVSSERFKVKSVLAEEPTKKLATELEQLRHAIGMLTQIDFEDPPIPTQVFVFDPASYAEFSSLKRSIGLFMPRMRANWVLMADVRDAPGRQTIQHEYVHFLLHNHGGFNYPRWYDEGFACFLSTVRTEDNKVEIGAPPLEALGLRAGSWIPISSLIADDDARPVAQFYGEAWALVHYLLWEREEKPSGAVTHYLNALEHGAKREAAFTEAFGLTPEQADREVFAYLNDRKLHVVKVEIADDAEGVHGYATRTRKVPVAEIATDLGELSLAIDGSDARAERALRYFQAAIAADPNRARAYAGSARALATQGKFAQAEIDYQKTLVLAPRDPIVELERGEYAFKRAEATNDVAGRAHWLKDARTHLIAAWKLDPDNPESYAFYGASFIAPGESPQKGLATLEHAAELLPSNLEIRLMRARIYLRLKRFDDAERVLTSVVSWLHDGDPTAVQIRRVLAQIAHARSNARPQS